MFNRYNNSARTLGYLRKLFRLAGMVGNGHLSGLATLRRRERQSLPWLPSYSLSAGWNVAPRFRRRPSGVAATMPAQAMLSKGFGSDRRGRVYQIVDRGPPPDAWRFCSRTYGEVMVAARSRLVCRIARRRGALGDRHRDACLARIGRRGKTGDLPAERFACVSAMASGGLRAQLESLIWQSGDVRAAETHAAWTDAAFYSPLISRVAERASDAARPLNRVNRSARRRRRS